MLVVQQVLQHTRIRLPIPKCMKQFLIFKKQFSTINFQLPVSNGFTLIELIIVFSVMAILSSIGIASFASYANSQKLRSAALDVKTVLQQARSQAFTQVKPVSCTGAGAFQGYEVRLCGVSGTNCSSTGNNDYELDAMCDSTAIVVSATKFVSGVSVDTGKTTQGTFHFTPITGGIANLTSGKATIVLDGANASSQTITVMSAGVIQ